MPTLTKWFITGTSIWQFKHLLYSSTVVRNQPASAGDTGSIPESGISPRVGNGSLLQYYCLENSLETGAWGLREVNVTEQLSARTHTHTHTHTHIYVHVLHVLYTYTYTNCSIILPNSGALKTCLTAMMLTLGSV